MDCAALFLHLRKYALSADSSTSIFLDLALILTDICYVPDGADTRRAADQSKLTYGGRTTAPQFRADKLWNRLNIRMGTTPQCR